MAPDLPGSDARDERPEGDLPAPGTDTPSGRRARDRDVLLVAAAVVAVVLGVELLGVIYPPLDDLVGLAPTVSILLVVVTVSVLYRAIRSSPRG